MSNGQEQSTQAGPQPQTAGGQPQQDIVNIFISHKHEDGAVARGVKKVLARYGGDRLKLFISEEIPPGEDWFKWIRERLVDSSLLLLIFTDPTATWDWCLYEAGLFTDLLGNEDHRKIICLHPLGVDRPRPLRNLQSVPAIAEKVQKWLQDLYGTDKLTGRAPLSDVFLNDSAELERAAEGIVKLIACEPVRTDHISDYLFIRVDDPKSLTPDRIPQDASVESNERTLRLFDKADGRWTWGDLETEARRSPDRRWLGELAVAIHRASEGNVVDPVQNTFHALRGGKTYRTVLYRTDTGVDGSKTFKVLLVEDISWQLQKIPSDLNTLLTAIVMGTRFRYEVLNPFAIGFPASGSDEAREVCGQMQQNIHNIEAEAASRGKLDKDALPAIFDNPADKNEVEEMYTEWYQIREGLFRDLENAATDAVSQHVNRLIEINSRFMLLVSRRYADMMAAGAN